MKNYFLSGMLLVVGIVFAQAQTKPIAKDLGLGFRINGLQTLSLDSWSEDQFETPQMLVRYYMTDRLALRVSFGAQGQNRTEEFSTTYTDAVRFTNPLRIDSAAAASVSQYGFSLSPGAEWHLGIEAPKLDPYVGAEIPFSYVTLRSESLDNEFTRTAEDGSVVYDEDLNIKTETDGGLSVGLNLLGGFNFFLTNNVAIGAEYRLGFAYSQVGGDVRVSTTGVIQPNGNVDTQIVVSRVESFKNTSTVLGLRTSSRAGINLSVFW